MTELDEDVVERVNQVGRTRWSGTVYRHALRRYDPMSGRGAYMIGGRWNPRESFDTVYLATPLATCVAELSKLAVSQGLEPTDLFKAPIVRMLHTIEVEELPVLDLRTDEALAGLGLERSDISDDDRTACQAVGHAAHFLGFGGVLAPSAVGMGFVLAAFENRLEPQQIRVTDSVPMTVQIYEAAIVGDRAADS